MARTVRLEGSVAEAVRTCLVYFVATAPNDPRGHVNCSPRANDGTLIVDGPDRLRIVDLVGSGAETIAHLRDNGRITVMIASFGERPLVVRIYGRGRARSPLDFPELASTRVGVRAVLDIAVEEVRTSCGYGVPIAEGLRPRPRLGTWLEAKGPEGLDDYVARHNRWSLDGLASIDGTWPSEAPSS